MSYALFENEKNIEMTAKEFYKTMWNPIYEDTDHPQFSYYEMIEFAEGYKQHLEHSKRLEIIAELYKKDSISTDFKRELERLITNELST